MMGESEVVLSTVNAHPCSRPHPSESLLSLPTTKIDYQEEMVLLFFNSMLSMIVDYTEILELASPVAPCLYIEKVTSNDASDDSYIVSRRRSGYSDFTARSIISGLISGAQLTPSMGYEVTSSQGDPSIDSVNPIVVSVSTPTPLKDSTKSTSGIMRKRRSGSFSRPSAEQRRAKSSTSVDARQNSKKNVSTSQDDFPKTQDIEECPSTETIPDWIIEAKQMDVNIKFKNGNSYEGQLFKQMMHGYGVFRWSNGTVYEGEFDEGRITGKGKMILPNLGVYEGELCQGIFHGQGTFNMQNTPMIYTGSWKLGKKHGKGWMLYEAGNYYDGEWYEDKRHGFGIRQYQNGDRYTGQWFNGERHGNGTMMWANNDYYKGEWDRGLMHGVGKYIWRTIKNTEFAFPAQNCYDGEWKCGMRHGKGVMNFGVNNGARLHGTWKNNYKEGAGTIICGNGKVISADRLYHHDKPVHTYSDTKFSSYDLSMSASVTRKQVRAFAPESRYTIDIQEVQEGYKAKPLCFPLDLPIHGAAANIDFNYYIEKVLKKCTDLIPPPEGYQEEVCTNASSYSELSKPPSYSKWNVLTWSSIHTAQRTTSEHSKHVPDYRKYTTAKKNENKQMKHLLTTYLPQLTELYSYYANLTVENKIPFEPIMIRLFLWQLYIDINVKDHNISLIEIDEAHAENENSGLISKYDPFEPIHFWQFVHSLLGVCWLVHLRDETRWTLPREGIVAFLFQSFLDKVVFIVRPKTKALCISKYLHLMPMKSVYQLYLKVGNPPTAGDFLRHTCVKSKSEPFCGLALRNQPRTAPITGHNVVPVGQEIMYIPDPEELGTAPNDNLKDVPAMRDPFFSSLKTFRILGPRRILNLLTKVCPRIKFEGMIVNTDYPLTFLEFYEILILCSTTLVDREIKKEKKVSEAEQDTSPEKKGLTHPPSEMKHSKKQSRDKKHPHKT